MTDDDARAGSNVTPIEAARTRDRARGDVADPSAQDSEGAIKPVRLWSAAQIAEEITRRAADPWIALKVGNTTLASVPLGEVAVLIGPTGSGKSSLALAMAVTHATENGPSLFVSCEMPATLVGGRVVGQCIDRTWADILKGTVETSTMTQALPSKFFVLERSDATRWQSGAKELALQYPGEPLVVIIDYVQILPLSGAPNDIRARVALAMDEISEWAIEARALVLVLSQTSRAGARALRSGEAVGWSATDAGAESASIERAAHVVIAIGERGLDRDDGSSEISLSIGKHRMGSGDLVLQAAYHGASGRWSTQGAPRRAEVVKAERDAARESSRISTAASAVAETLDKASGPMSRGDVRIAIGMNNAATRAAITRLIKEQTVVEIEGGRGGRKVWTAEHARAAKLTIVGQAFDSGEANGDALILPTDEIL
jgi:energy-coupling factor transporter ATP-binding protein EcfA2